MNEGSRFDRRSLLKRGGLLALAASMPVPLAACGKTTQVEPDRAVAFVYASGPADEAFIPLNPPLADFARLLTDKAKEEDVNFAVTSKEPRRQLARYVAPTEFDPATGKTPAQYAVVVVSVPGLKLGPGVAKAVKDGVKLVAFLYPIEGAAATISVDPRRMGTMLGEDVLDWARQKGESEILLVERDKPLPYPPYSSVPFTATEPQSGAALRKVIDSSGSVRIAATVTVANEDSEDGIRAEYAVRSALAAKPNLRTVVCLDDSASLGAARALAEANHGEAADLYVGGLGAPAASSLATLEALEGPGCLRTLVAASPAALADAMVETSSALLEGTAAEDIAVSPVLLTRGSAALKNYERDYTPHGYLGVNQVSEFFVLNPAHRQVGVPVGPRRPGS